AFIRDKRSQLLVLDEPTAALDPRSESEIYNRFSELVMDKTAILVTHRLASVSMCDRIMVLKAGQLIEEGTHQELLQQQEEYAHLWQIQAQAYQI
ncbi:MAG: ABC transporter ATP-binding protein, partial [Cyanobacteria bacterium J06638_38]